MASQQRMVGAFGKEKAATERTQNIADSVKDEVVKEWRKICKARNIENDEITEYQAISWKSQIVAGTNYIIKVEIGPDEYVAMKVYEPLPYAQAPTQLKGLVPWTGGELDFSWFHQ